MTKNLESLQVEMDRQWPSWTSPYSNKGERLIKGKHVLNLKKIRIYMTKSVHISKPTYGNCFGGILVVSHRTVKMT